MRVRQLMTVLAIGSVTCLCLAPNAAAAQDYIEDYPQEYVPDAIEARVWLDRGAEPVLQRGERARIYYRVSESAFVAIFHIDTNGTLRMVFPSSPQENHFARGSRDYRVLFPGSSYWYVSDDPGIGYFFIVASPEPFDFQDFGYSHYAGGWDLSGVGSQVYGDPYLAMDDYVAALIPDWEYVGYGLDFTSYHVEQRHEYPRFLCYDCHPFQPYYGWNPYLYSCTSFRVVIYSDPYYYPATRYRGTRVVYVQPRRGVPRFAFKERAVGEAGTPHVVVRNTPPVAQPGVKGTENRRPVSRIVTPQTFSSGARSGSAPGTTGQDRSGVEGTANRRSGTSRSAVTGSSGTAPGTASGGSRSSSSNPGSVRTDPVGSRSAGTNQRPVLQRRPSERGSTATPPRSTQTQRTTVIRPSSRVSGSRGGGAASGSGSSTARTSGTSVRRPPTTGTGGTPTRSTATTGSSGRTTRSTPTIRSRGTGSGNSAAARTGGSVSRSTLTGRAPTSSSRGTAAVRSGVRSGASTQRSSPTQRMSASRGVASSSRAQPRAAKPPPTAKPPARPKPKRTTGGGGR